MIQRQRYLDKLVSKKENGMIKVITGIKQCGKSYLLFEIYHQYLNSVGVDDDHIITLALDDDKNIRYRNPLELGQYIHSLIVDEDRMYFVFLDGIQKVAAIPNSHLSGGDEKVSFEDILLGLMEHKNIDLYVTGSNLRMLFSDALRVSRGRVDEIRVNPLSYKEFYDAYGENKHHAWREYFSYGGMPLVLMKRTSQEKCNYLHDLLDKIYLDDIMAYHKIGYDKYVLDDLLDIVASSVGSLTNPIKISNAFSSLKGLSVTNDTIGKYLDFFLDAYMLYKAKRYDVKSRKQIGSPLKYYYSDAGLLNVRLNFRQQEENHIMENIIYNELVIREFDVDIGIVASTVRTDEGKNRRVQYEVNFVANKRSKRYYIQSAFAIPNEEERKKITRPLNMIQDSFKKIVIVREGIEPWHDENGILYIGIEQFLLDDTALDL